VFSFSTCTDCGELLHVTAHAQTVHPGCLSPPWPTKLEALYDRWTGAIAQGNRELEKQLEAQITELESQPPRLLDAALIYAAWGWEVFPLLPLARAAEIAQREGMPLSKVAKRPTTKHGFKDATTDTDEIRQWWERHPDSNIGVATGHLFDVVDVDTHKGGMDSYRRLVAAEDDAGHGPIPDVHGKVATTSGGWHLYVQPMGYGNTADTGKSPLPGIDFRGRGGYVVCPPSWLGRHEERWSWTIKPSPKIRKPK
jgi:hypothetical protein